MTAMDFDDPEVARAASEAHAALTSLLAPSQTVTRAGTMLRMVRQGLRDMQETGQDRILLGFLGVVVFGRSMTLVMQNLRRHDQDAFDSWYSPWRTEMKDDPLMRYFYDLRTKVIHHDAPAIGILLAGQGENVPQIGSITVDGLPLPAQFRTKVEAGRKVTFGLRPDDIYPSGHGIHSGEASDVHEIELPVSITEPLGNETLVFAEFDGSDWVSRMLNPKPLKSGDKVRMSLDLSQAHLFDAATGRSLRG